LNYPAKVIEYIAEEMYPNRTNTLSEDNLSALKMNAMYEIFAPQKAR